MVLSRSWRMKKVLFTGAPTSSHFELFSEELSEPKYGEIITKTLFITVDPYLRGIMRILPIGSQIPSGQIAKVISSGDNDFPVGTLLITQRGWCDHAKFITKGEKGEDKGVNVGSISSDPNRLEKIPDIGKLSPSLLLGACGMPGVTAYWGLLDLCKPKPGETLFVNAAAGAVGSLVGQIAKSKGLRVIGSAGDDAKVEWLRKDLKFDYVFNYKKIRTEDALKEAAPNGIDCFYENVGGPASSEVIKKMNLFGRIAVCGSISVYNDEKPTMVPSFIQYMIYNQIKMEGFVVARYRDRWNDAVMQLAQWISDGKLEVKETIIDGFELTPQAFINLFSGTSTGKTIVKL